MTYYLIIEYILPISLGIVAIFFFGLAVLGIVGKRPLLVSHWLRMSMFALGLLGLFLHSLRQITAPPWFGIDTIILSSIAVIGIPLLITYLWCYRRGFIITATPRDTVHSALLRVLEKQKISYENSSGITLKDHDLKLRASNFLIFTATALRIKGKDSGVLKRILPELLEEIAQTDQTRVPQACVDQILCGLIVGSIGFGCWAYATQLLPL